MCNVLSAGYRFNEELHQYKLRANKLAGKFSEIDLLLQKCAREESSLNAARENAIYARRKKELAKYLFFHLAVARSCKRENKNIEIQQF